MLQRSIFTLTLFCAVFLCSANAQQSLQSQEIKKDSKSTAIVYFTKDISPESLLKMYNKLGVKLNGKVAVKISTGEMGNKHYLKPALIKDVVEAVNGKIVECNTAYGGSRGATKVHEHTIKAHGFDKIGGVDILDRDGSMTLKVVGGDNLKENYVGKNLANYDSMLVLSHFKGHTMGGFGGALKNISIGVASSMGKAWIHSAGKSKINPWTGKQNNFLESMAESAKSVSDYFGSNIVYINVMNHLSVDCDCDGTPSKPTMADIGILASTDPVALDKACVDLVYKAKDGKDLIKRIESRNGVHIFTQAKKMNYGTLNYKLVNVD